MVWGVNSQPGHSVAQGPTSNIHSVPVGWGSSGNQKAALFSSSTQEIPGWFSILAALVLSQEGRTEGSEYLS